MAAKAIDGTEGYTFQWKIENISHSWCSRKGQSIVSPTFITDALERTKWSLCLFPMGIENEYFIDLYLRREKDCNGPNNIEVKFRLAFMGKDGSVLKQLTTAKISCERNAVYGFDEYESREKVFNTERETFLPEDTLTVQITIWSKGIKPTKQTYLYARTVFKENRKFFEWKIDKFSNLKYIARNEFKDNLIDFNICLNEEPDFEKKMVLNINSFDEDIKYFSVQTTIVNSEGQKENWGIHEYFADDLKKGILSTELFTKKLIENKNRYLPIGVLFIYCEYAIITKTESNEFFHPGITFSKLTKAVDKSKNNQNIGKEKSEITSDLMDDLKSMYADAILCDTELHTSNRTFSVHKNILSARSPVFRRMFSNDMKEKNSGQVDITDLEDDTVHRMLLYIYTDTLQDLQLDIASKLYAAADKYEVLSLKSKCSSFIKDNLSPTKVCDVLILVDLHQDNDLKSFVEDYILEHDKEVFGCQEWKDFMKTNLKLAADIMYQKLYPG